MSKTTFYKMQSNYLFRVIDSAWQDEKAKVLNEAKENGYVKLNGDGRCDSPGHTAKYGTYTMMSDEGKILTFSLVQSSEVSSSNAMEKERV